MVAYGPRKYGNLPGTILNMSTQLAWVWLLIHSIGAKESAFFPF